MKNFSEQFFPKIKVHVSSLRKYTGSAELYAHAFLSTSRYAPEIHCISVPGRYFFYLKGEHNIYQKMHFKC